MNRWCLTHKKSTPNILSAGTCIWLSRDYIDRLVNTPNTQPVPLFLFEGTTHCLMPSINVKWQNNCTLKMTNCITRIIMLGYGSSLTLPPTITEVGNGFPTHGEHGHSQATTTQNTNSLKPINKNIESFTWICDCLMLGKSSKHILP